MAFNKYLKQNEKFEKDLSEYMENAPVEPKFPSLIVVSKDKKFKIVFEYNPYMRYLDATYHANNLKEDVPAVVGWSWCGGYHIQNISPHDFSGKIESKLQIIRKDLGPKQIAAIKKWAKEN